ncbi:cobyrinate a,c-diamide synthase [Ruminococcus flavefaciens]|uniref:cobyrinate a,c-diamide synthase n=1 Tax=Ruminococcus flavefaciens TaxID=1265 RepID=UPI0026F29D20|nr:cobyrinate a,c-diamide synthase [Ruminococcus flavefaciens]
MKRILIGGTHSGCGKTTVTCAVLAALKARGLTVSSFKCGPDYIDPMFHSSIIGADAHNLDSFFCDDNCIRQLLWENGKNADISVIEGVMGYYDGADGRGSAHSVAAITDTASVIVLDCKGSGESIGAVMKGFLMYKIPNNIAGFIFNRLPARLVPMAERLCTEIGTEYFGCMPPKSPSIENRRLGLVTAVEIADLREKTAELGRLAEENIRLDRMIEVSERCFPEFTEQKLHRICADNSPKIAVAADRAFCFTYSENISLLKRLGCAVEYFSPMEDEKLPDNCRGLILSGGYPELHAERLAANSSMRECIKTAINRGLPTIAECGGFMYLHDSIRTSDGTEYPMAGVIGGTAFETDRLQRFGYVTMTAERDCLLCCKGESFPAHEFHYWDSTDCGADFTAAKSDGRSWKCVHATSALYAGFPHLYFYSDVRLAERFAAACDAYGGK